MDILGKVLGTFSAPKGYKEPIRPKVDFLQMIKNHGIKNDKFAQKDAKRTVMIVGNIAYDIALKENIQIQYGSLGENIITDFNPHSLNSGDIIQIGEATLKITEACSICSHLSIHDKRLPKLLAKHRGVYCEIINNGIVKEGFKVCKL